MPKTDDQLTRFPFLEKGGETGRLIAEKDWSHSPMGNIEQWPDSLKLTLGIILTSQFPKILVWGPELICLYNDAYSQTLGSNGRHPKMLGKSAENAWPENWELVQQIIEEVYEGKPSVLKENMMVPTNRTGHLESAYWTFNAGPVIELDGSISGVLMTLLETTQQSKLMEELKNNEMKFRNFIFEVPIGILQVSAHDYTVELVNESYLKMVDRAEADFVGHPFFEALPEVKNDIQPLFKNVVETGRPYFGNEFPLVLNRYGKNQTAYFNFVYNPVRNEKDEIGSISMVAIEVTSSVQQRISLQESKKQFEKMVVESPIGMTIVRGPDLIIEMANEAMLTRIWNLPASEVIGRPLLEVFPELKDQKYPEQLNKVFQTGKAITENESLALVKSTDGLRRFYLDYEYAPLTDADGIVDGIMVTIYDVTEKVEAKNNQIEIKERLQLSLNATGVAIWDYELATKHFFFSEQLPVIFGFEHDANPTIQDLFQSVFPEEIKGVHEAWEKAIETGFYKFEGRICKPDNETTWVSVKGKIFFDDDQQPLKVMGTLRDVTIEKKNQKELERNERRLRRLILQAPVAIGILRGPHYRVEIMNKSALKLMGKTEQQMMGQHVLEVMKEFDTELAKKMLDEVYYEGKTISANEFPIKILRDSKLEKVYINFEYDPLRNELGEVIGIIVVGTEVTGQVLARKRVEESESRFRLLADSLPHFVWTADKKGDVNYFNRTMRLYTDPKLHNDGPFQWLDCVHPEERDSTQTKWEHSLQDGNEFIAEHRLCRYDGEYRWYLTRANPLLDENGNIQIWIATSTDIQTLKEQDQQKDFFISRASHELKTPITSVKGYVQILQSMYENSSDGMLTNSLSRINIQVDKLTRLIGDLLDVTKLNSGGMVLHRHPFSVNELIKEMEEDTALAYPEFKITHLEVCDVWVNADKERISQVLVNFLTNAIKYSPHNKEIIIETAFADGNLKISVRDHGIGVNKAFQRKIFEKFYRVQGKSEETFPGFGIGLFIAAEIVKKHGGEIGVDSEPGKGSCFYFTIPLTNDETSIDEILN